MPEQKKLKIGWFSYSCCEDSTIVMTELLNDHYQEWLKVLDVRNAKILRRDKPIDDLDVAFIEGAIASPKQEKAVQEIRSKSKKVVAVGACACTGMPSAHRNLFDEKTTEEIEPIIDKFIYGDKVKKLSEVITVDAQVPGCPMIPEKFIEVVNQMLKEFNIV